MSSKMTRQQAFYSLSQIFDHMESISTLSRLWSRSLRSRSIVASAISADRHQVGILAHPGRRGLRFAVRQEIHDVLGLQIDQDRAKPAPTQEGKVVYAKKEDRFGGGIRQSHDVAQDRLTSRSYSQTSRESGASFATRRQANGGDLLTISNRHPGRAVAFSERKKREGINQNLSR